MTYSKLESSAAVAILLLALFLTASSTTRVEPVRKVTGLVRPDIIVVHNFATSAAEIELDRGLGPRISRGLSAFSQTQEEIQVGQTVAGALSTTLVKELNDAGIPAVLAGQGVRITDRTASLKGIFTTVDEGSRTARAAIGFGLGRSKVRTRGLVYQGTPSNERLLGEFQTVAKGSMKPGMGPAGAAGASLAVSAGTTAVSEKFFTAVEKDAKSTAKKIAKRIKQYYQQHGWS